MIVSLIKNYSDRFKKAIFGRQIKKSQSLLPFSSREAFRLFLNSDNYQGRIIIHERLREIREIIPIHTITRVEYNWFKCFSRRAKTRRLNFDRTEIEKVVTRKAVNKKFVVGLRQ